MSVIKLEDLTIDRGGKRLFNRIDLEILAGAKTVIVGPSGSGKTSILMAIMGAFAPTEGRIIYNGEEVVPKNIDAVRADIAFISQEPVMGADMVGDALLLPFSFRAYRDDQPAREQINRTLERLRLDPSITESLSVKISAGEKQRIAIARAMLLGKRVFLVDEATSALDPDSKAAAAEMLNDPSFTVLSVSHDQYWIDRCQTVLRVTDRSLQIERSAK